MSKWSSAFRDSRWQQKRLEIMERDKWTCRSCNASGEGVTLNVHHAYYESGKAPWEYPIQSLVTWCEQCHEVRHKMQNSMMEELSRKPIHALVGAYLLSINYEDFLTYVGKHDSLLPDDDNLCAVVNAVSSVYYAGMESVADSDGECLASARKIMDQEGGDK